MAKLKTKNIKADAKKPKVKSKGKKKETRDKILNAASQIFASYPYHTASIRMIGKQAEIEHPLISYYFASKADLFRTVLTSLSKNRRELEISWYEEIKTMSTARGLALFIDYVLDDFRNRPGLLHIIALNLSQPPDLEPIPAFDIIQDFMEFSVKSFVDSIKTNCSAHEGEMFARTFSSLMVMYLGASNTFATLINKDPNSIIYYNWVKDALIFTLLPRLEEMTKSGGGKS